jgi:hypothetical protein
VITYKQVPTATTQHATTDVLLEVAFPVVRAAAVVYISVAMNQHSTAEELLEMVFSTWSVPRGYQWDKFRA